MEIIAATIWMQIFRPEISNNALIQFFQVLPLGGKGEGEHNHARVTIMKLRR